jgi:hypothetical protein
VPTCPGPWWRRDKIRKPSREFLRPSLPAKGLAARAQGGLDKRHADSLSCRSYGRMVWDDEHRARLADGDFSIRRPRYHGHGQICALPYRVCEGERRWLRRCPAMCMPLMCMGEAPSGGELSCELELITQTGPLKPATLQHNCTADLMSSQ